MTTLQLASLALLALVALSGVTYAAYLVLLARVRATQDLAPTELVRVDGAIVDTPDGARLQLTFARADGRRFVALSDAPTTYALSKDTLFATAELEKRAGNVSTSNPLGIEPRHDH